MNRMRFGIAVCLCLVLAALGVEAQDVFPASNEDEPGATVGVRPYEMDWAGRTAPKHPQLVDFEDLADWQVRCFSGADARVFRSREKLLFGEYTAKAVYSGGNAQSRFILEPPEPIEIPVAFTGVNLWMHGNNWGFINPPQTARVGIEVMVRDAKGEDYVIPMGVNNADFWSVLHNTCISPDGKHRHYHAIGTDNDGVIDFPAYFTGIQVSECSNKVPAKLFFDALSFYEMAYEPLEFAPIPEDLPWPTRADTILPTVTNVDEAVEFTYRPETGTLSDLTARASGQEFAPCWDGAIVFEIQGERVRPGQEGVEVAYLGEEQRGGGVLHRWQLTHEETSVTYSYLVSVKNKSCIIDVACSEPCAVRFDIGLAKGLHAAKAVYMPYLTYGEDWPRIVCSEGPGGRVFLLSLLDYYHSDASELFGAPYLKEEGAVGYAGGSAYKPKTDGTLNPLRERLFINVSSEVHEVLPNIPNPVCDTGDMARECLWCNIGSAHQRERLSKYKAYGIDKFIACHHEVGWREAGESFTMRDRPAPSIGEQELADYGAFVKGLGYRFGTYTNYVDFAPVNANWNEDDVCLDSEGRWQTAWPRNYALKPLRAVEKEAHYAPLIHEKYGTTAQYCDVHTAYTPWGRTDYDARTPGAGMFCTQFNSFARLLWNESKAHHGPVFSEGNHHWFYAGIVDGNYATMLPYGGGWRVPHLVDFDLLKMHPKMTDFGMGYGNMYFGEGGEWAKDSSRLSPWFDRFITATIAYGHIGFLSYEWGFEGTLKSYYMHQALQKRYAMVPVKAIRYFDGEKLIDTSTALITDAYKRNQVYIEYENGLQVWCNLSFDQDWAVEVVWDHYILPPAGFIAYRKDDIIAYSVAGAGGQRKELVQCADYLYTDTRGRLVRMWPVSPDLDSDGNLPVTKLTTRGAVVVKPDGPDAWWIIPVTKCEEVSVEREWLRGYDEMFSAEACDLAGGKVADAEVRHGSRGITVMPVSDDRVAKYHLKRAGEAELGWGAYEPWMPVQGSEVSVRVNMRPLKPIPRAQRLLCSRVYESGKEEVVADVPIEINEVGNRFPYARFNLLIPQDAPPKTRCWYRLQLLGANGCLGEDSWFDITVRPPSEIALERGEAYVVEGQPYELRGTIRRNLWEPVEATISLAVEGIEVQPAERTVLLQRGTAETLSWTLTIPDEPIVAELRLRAATGEHDSEIVRYLQTSPTEWVVADLTKIAFEPGVCIRGQNESGYDAVATGASVMATNQTVGGDPHPSVFMHPPYKTGVGYAFAEYDISLPEGDPQLRFSLGFRDGSTTQDGCLFKAIVIDGPQEAEVFAEQFAVKEEWAERSADLSAYAGRRVKLKLVTDVGPADNSYSDWGVWGAPRVVMGQNALAITLLDERPESEFAPPPEPLEGLLSEDLRNVKEAVLRLDTAGVNHGDHTSYIHFNGVNIGATPASRSDTEWQPGEVALTPEAIQSIGPLNRVVIKNPGMDYMKVQRFCLHFELNDGRKGSSYVALGPFCSASGWAHQEGESVPVGQNLPAAMLSIPLD